MLKVEDAHALGHVLIPERKVGYVECKTIDVSACSQHKHEESIANV
jgi:hypothetical protein